MENFETEEDFETTDDLQEKLSLIRESLNGRFLQVVIMTRDGNLITAATADIDEPDAALTRMISIIFDAALRAGDLLPHKYVN